MKHQQFDFHEQHGLDGRTPRVLEQRLQGLTKLKKIDVFIGASSPVVESHQGIEQPAVVVRDLWLAVRQQHPAPSWNNAAASRCSTPQYRKIAETTQYHLPEPPSEAREKGLEQDR
jgi:hypothetical protein